MYGAIDSGALRPFYSRFLDPSRVLLTGHSHQAWPDTAEDGLREAFDDAARLVDDKWEAADRVARALREFIALRIGAGADEIALGQNTHELVSRFLSAVELPKRPHVVTSGGEFHSMRRQLRRLEEEGVAVSWVATEPSESFAARVLEAVRADTAAVMVSSVLFETSAQVEDLPALAAELRSREVPLLVDAYHAFGVVPLDLGALGEDVFLVAGGYKYAQWGEGCCFLRVPTGCCLRPVHTGWFSDFAGLERAHDAGPIGYGDTPASRFAGSTYDPSSHYRARAVIRFFEREGLSVERLRARSLEQTELLFAQLDGFDVVTPRAAPRRGGFVSVRVPDAASVCRELRSRGVYVDSRGELLRLGPAPYTTDDELARAVDALRAVVR